VRAFVDSNIAVYALGPEDDPRCWGARAVLARHGSACEIVISTQVLLETYNVLRRKKNALPARALAAARMLMRYEVVTPSAAAAIAALTLAADHGLPTYDAFIVQAALEGGCDTLFSEDLQAGRRFDKLVVVNPFDTGAHEAAPGYATAPSSQPRQRAPAAGKPRRTRT
jgi:predicted nucleic acid-binding protein